MVAAAAASVPVAALLGKGALQLAQTPVIGWQRTVRQLKGKKHPKEVITQHSVSLRAWEVAAAAGVALVGSWILLNKEGLLSLDKLKPFLWLSPPVAAAVYAAEALAEPVSTGIELGLIAGKEVLKPIITGIEIGLAPWEALADSFSISGISAGQLGTITPRPAGYKYYGGFRHRTEY